MRIGRRTPFVGKNAESEAAAIAVLAGAVLVGALLAGPKLIKKLVDKSKKK